MQRLYFKKNFTEKLYLKNFIQYSEILVFLAWEDRGQKELVRVLSRAKLKK
jgi:hypothetical protein